MPASDLEPTPRPGSDPEWLFRTEGQVFGPVPESKLLDLLYEGRVGAATEVAVDAGAWRRLGDLPRFSVEVKKAEAHARVHAEVRARERAERRRRAVRGGLAVVAVIGLVLVVALVAWWLATRRPWERDSALLADFGGGISVGEVRVGGEAPGSGEVALPEASPGGPRPADGAASAVPGRVRRGESVRPPATASAPGRSRAVSGSAEGGDLVMAHFDPRMIKDVVARRQGSLAPCLRDEARRSPDLRGEIPIEFAVGNDGKVAQLWVLDPRFRSGELRDCLARTLEEWRFQPFPGERPVVSLAFRIGE